MYLKYDIKILQNGKKNNGKVGWKSDGQDQDHGGKIKNASKFEVVRSKPVSSDQCSQHRLTGPKIYDFQSN